MKMGSTSFNLNYQVNPSHTVKTHIFRRVALALRDSAKDLSRQFTVEVKLKSPLGQDAIAHN